MYIFDILGKDIIHISYSICEAIEANPIKVINIHLEFEIYLLFNIDNT